MHSEQWALSCVRALFDLRKALTEKNCPVMDEESENTLPASIHLGGLHGTAIEGAHQGICGDQRAAGTAPGGPGARADSDHQEPKLPPWEVGRPRFRQAEEVTRFFLFFSGRT